MKKTKPTTEPTQTVIDLFYRLGNPITDKGQMIWQAAWLVDHGHLPWRKVETAANGPKQVGGIANPIGYFRVCLENDIGKEKLAQALRRLPRRRTWPADNPNRRRCPSDFIRACRPDLPTITLPREKTQYEFMLEVAKALRESGCDANP